MVPLARAFAARGHDVVWAAAPTVCSRLEHAGFRALPAGPEADEMFGEFARRFPEIRALPPERRPDRMFPKLFGAVFAPAMLTELLPLSRDVAPDLVVHDQAELAGPIVAAALGTPWLTHAFGRMLPPRRPAAAGP